MSSWGKESTLHSTVSCARQGGILVLFLNNPKKKNALEDATYLALAGALRDAAADSDVTAVVITAKGDYFCSGTDVQASLGPAMVDPSTAPVGKFMLAVLRFPKILVAAVNGPAIGIGVTLLPHCDLVYSATSATFWTPFLRIAVVPEFGSSLTFPRVLGSAVAGDMLYASRVLTAEEALRWGLVSELFPASTLLTDVVSRLEDILALPLGRSSLLMFKKLLWRWTQEEVEKVVEEEFRLLGKRYVDGETKHAVELSFAELKRGKASRVARTQGTLSKL